MKYKGPRALNLGERQKYMKLSDAQKEKYKENYTWGFSDAPEVRNSTLLILGYRLLPKAITV